MAIVYLGIGSNLGDRYKNIQNAYMHLEDQGIIILRKSNIIETQPQGGPRNQNKYLNSVIKIETQLDPFELLDKLQHIEASLGRVRTVRNGSRTIDIDILYFNNLQINTDLLTIPHPRIEQRKFVLIPLQEIAPELLRETNYANN